MRTIWNGSISFGLVNIPIGLALATQRTDVSFRTLHRECGTPIKQKRWCPFHEREVEADELVKGWEVAKGEFVLVEESDLESVALQRSQSIEILRFVKLADVDPVYFDRTYYLAPAAADAARRPVRAAAPRDAGDRAWRRSASSCSGARRTSASSARRATRSRCETLFFAEDVRAKNEIEEAVEATTVQKAELRLAEQVIESLVGEWSIEDFENEYRRELKRDARGEARGRGDQAAGAGRGDAGHRPDGGAAPQRRRGAGREERRREARESRKPARGTGGSGEDGSRKRKTRRRATSA